LKDPDATAAGAGAIPVIGGDFRELVSTLNTTYGFDAS
jgi:hypothetical protein